MAIVHLGDGSFGRWFLVEMIHFRDISVPIVHFGHGSFWRPFVFCDVHSSDGSFVTMVHRMVHCGHDKQHLHETIVLHW